MLLVTASVLTGATLRVDPTSGPFTTIQEAVDAADTGDTISIAPGDYRTSQIFEFSPALPSGETFLAVSTDSLTLLGDDRDSVVIGPATASFVGYLPKGIATRFPAVTSVTVKNVTIENVRDGIYIAASATLDNVRIQSCGLAVLAAQADEFVLTNSEIAMSSVRGAVTILDVGAVTVVATMFDQNWASSLFFSTGTNGTVDMCQFRGGGGLTLEGSSSATVTRCTFQDLHSRGISLSSGSTLVLVDSTIEADPGSLLLGGNSSVTASGNVLVGGTDSNANIAITGTPTVQINHNDIHLSPGYTVSVGGFVTPPVQVLDLTNNYWTTTDEAVIQSEILDGNVDPLINAVVEFRPVLQRSIPTRRTSMGAVRALFGNEAKRK